jgi:FixJ family two-component response regulator
MAETQSVVYVLDDDSDVRNAMDTLMRSVGYKVRTFTSAAEFLGAKLSDVPGCLVLDVRMPGMSGLDLQSEMTKAHVDMPIIFITGHADVAMAVKVMKAGAVEFLTKPFRDQDLLDSIQHAVERNRLARQHRAGLVELRRRFNSLTKRQREVMEYVVKGLLNKQIAVQLGTSETTIKLHRGQVMLKMQAHSLPDLVRAAICLGVPSQTY